MEYPVSRMLPRARVTGNSRDTALLSLVVHSLFLLYLCIMKSIDKELEEYVKLRPRSWPNRAEIAIFAAPSTPSGG